MSLWLIQDGYLKEVHLEFMVSGHSMMPCDRTFGTLEKKFKKRETIDTPEEYREVINATNHSTAIKMGQDDLINFKYLLKYIQFRKAKTVLFSNSRRIILSEFHPWSMKLVTSSGTEMVNLNKRTNKHAMKTLQELLEEDHPELPRKYKPNQHIKITESKLDHLQSLRPYLTPRGRAWVDSVTIGQRTAVPRPRTDDQHTQECEETISANNMADEYCDVPPHNLPPGYLENATVRGPPPAHSQASTSTPSSTTRGAKRKLPQETSSTRVSKRPKHTPPPPESSSDKDTTETD